MMFKSKNKYDTFIAMAKSPSLSSRSGHFLELHRTLYIEHLVPWYRSHLKTSIWNRAKLKDDI